MSVRLNFGFCGLDLKDTRKLEHNLKSLSKFYDTLNDVDKQKSVASNRQNFGDVSSLTVHNLIELAKAVSDKMIISKAKVKNVSSKNKRNHKIFFLI